MKSFNFIINKKVNFSLSTMMSKNITNTPSLLNKGFLFSTLSKNFSFISKNNSKSVANVSNLWNTKGLSKGFFGKKEKKEDKPEEAENMKESTTQDNEKAEEAEKEIKNEKSNEDNKKENTTNKKEEEIKKEETVTLKKYNELKTLFNESEDNLKKARTKFDELRKAYIDMQQDLDRVRKRSETEVANAKDFAISKFAKDLLDVHDNFSRALESLDNMDKSDNEEENTIENKLKIHEDFVEGIKMTKSSLNRILNFHGVKEYNPLKEKFDPNVHEALAQIPAPSEEYSPGSVAGVMQTGFMIGKRVLRPAKVAVVKK